MSTYTIPISGPSARLAFLRALAVKAFRTSAGLLSAARHAAARGAAVLRSTAATLLAALGSPAGYQLARHTTRTLTTLTHRALRGGVRLLARATGAMGHGLVAATRLVSPQAADTLDTALTRWIATPITRACLALDQWTSTLAGVVWDLSGTRLVTTVTTRAAQTLGVVLAIHTLTQGAAAARIVQALPAAMDTVLVLTNPWKALTLVAGAFLTALGYAAYRAWTTPTTTDPEVDEPVAADHPVEEVAVPGTDQSVDEDLADEVAGVDTRQIAAALNVEVAPDGSVLVHGIPATLPEDIALQVAHIAADAATARLERILLHRPQPNRDDRRLLTKVAREAVRTAGRKAVRADT